MNAEAKDTGFDVAAESRALLTKKTVARRVGVCPRTLERLIACGTFPKALRIGTALRWHPVDVEDFVTKAMVARQLAEGKL